MDSTGLHHSRRYKLGETVWCNGRWATVIGVVGWRESILTMTDWDAIAFTDSVKATHGLNYRETYQNVCVSFGEQSKWIEARLLNVEQISRQAKGPERSP
jgi:hypothetical protein